MKICSKCTVFQMNSAFYPQYITRIYNQCGIAKTHLSQTDWFNQ